MNKADIAPLRLRNQNIASSTFTEPVEVVRHLGAVQSQDYGAAKWAVGLRMQNATDSGLDAAFDNGQILRTHVLRPTWHFVTPEDIRWMLALTAPRVHALCAFAYRRCELDTAIIKKIEKAIGNALRGGTHLTRPELAEFLTKAGIETDGRMTMVMMQAELEGLVCGGARRGKQHTYALLDERVPSSKTLSREEALAELTRRYFTGHGPATLKDYIWWSGLSAADAKNGLERVKDQFTLEVIDGETYWFASPTTKPKKTPLTTCLLPNYDEYLVGYTDRSALFDAKNTKSLGSRGSVLFENTIVINGQVVGTWKKDVKKDTMRVAVSLFAHLSLQESAAVAAEVKSYGRFLQREIIE